MYNNCSIYKIRQKSSKIHAWEMCLINLKLS